MKKILFTLMLLLCATAGWALDQDENGYYQVSNLQELKDAVNATKDSGGKSTSKIKLTDNIYLNGMEGTLCTTFAGEIDGKYTLKNNKGEDVELMYAFYGSTFGDEGTRKKCSYLFTYLNEATIKNVAFCNIRVESDDRDNMGVIASTATSTTFEQITFDRCSVFTDENNAGAVVGQATDCKFHVVFVNSCDITVDGVRAGGFVGNSENNQYVFGGSGLGTAVFADGNNATNAGWSGGIAGYSKNDNFFYMANLALVGADQNFVGGYAGESEGSDFVRCQNSGAVLQINEEDSNPKKSFRAIHEKMLEEINKKKSTSTLDVGLDVDTKLIACALNVSGDLDVESILDLNSTPASASPRKRVGAVAAGAGLYGCIHINTSIGWFEVLTVGEQAELVATVPAGAGMSFTAACAIGATVAVAIIATAIAIYIFNGDDEVGGICGKATGGFFEQCTNNSTLSCKDDNCGGIVGLGKGVTINNCLNTGQIIYDEKVCSGSILGQAKANGSKKCKVTNCFSSEPLQIIGSWYIKDGVDDASGNNYRPLLGDKDVCDWEFAIPNFYASFNLGLVGYWLNNGVENRHAGIAPWRYTPSALAGQGLKYPDLDPTHNEITIEVLGPAHISTADDLFNFATMVNNGFQFKTAVLDNDIVIPEGRTWIPIGKNETAKHFRGIFDGQGHTISGLEVDDPASDEQGVGLFGAVHANAIIRNVTVKESVFPNFAYGGAAGIVGRVHIGWYSGNVLIENCASYADVYAYKHGGGILGRVSTGSNEGPSVNVYVENCYNGGTITAVYGNSGLLCGYTKNHGHIRNCWSEGQLRYIVHPTFHEKNCPYSTENSKNNEPEYLVGYNDKIDIQNCYILNAKDIIDMYVEGEMQDGVTNIEEAKLATGEFTYMLNGSTNDVTKSLGWQQELGVDAMPKLGNKGVYHTRSISNTIGTVCLPYALKSDEAISYYTFDASSDDNSVITLNFNYTDSVAPGTPVLFKVAETGDVNFSGVGTGWADSPVAPASPAWDFTGTYEQCNFTGDATKTIYYVSNGAIRHSSNSVTIAPYRAYFVGPSIDELTTDSNAKHVRIVIDGEEGETSVLELVYENHNDNRSYTLFGTEVGEGYRGIVIRGGKKVVVND